MGPDLHGFTQLASSVTSGMSVFLFVLELCPGCVCGVRITVFAHVAFFFFFFFFFLLISCHACVRLYRILVLPPKGLVSE